MSTIYHVKWSQPSEDYENMSNTCHIRVYTDGPQYRVEMCCNTYESSAVLTGAPTQTHEDDEEPWFIMNPGDEQNENELIEEWLGVGFVPNSYTSDV